MWLTATGIFLGTQINFLEPIPSNSNFLNQTQNIKIEQDYSKHFSRDRYSTGDLYQSFHVLASRPNQTASPPIAIDTSSFANLTLKHNPNSSNDLHTYSYSYEEQPINFKPGVASWKTKTKLGALTLNGKFDRQAHFTEGKAFWNTDTKLGSVDLAINLNNRLEPLKSFATWKTDSVLGSFAIKGNFNEETTFMGGDAAWNAKTALGEVAVKGNFNEETTFMGGNAAWKANTALGSLSLKGNFNEETTFTGGNIKISTKTFIGSLTADFKIDEETQFKGANASWDTKFILGSNIGVSGKFNETSSFDGGSIKFGKNTPVGNLNLKADVDGEMKFTEASVKLRFALP